MITNIKYNMSFTAGALLYRESVILAELYFALGDWVAVRNQVIEKNILQTRTISSLKRTFSEVSSRLKLLSIDEIKILANGTRQEQNYILWLAICKRYRFIHDFAVEVIREKFYRLDLELSLKDYEIFFNTKSEWHNELEHLKTATRSKLRQIVFKMLHESELLSNKYNKIQSVILTKRIVQVIYKDSYPYFAIFPITESEIKEMVK